MGASNSRMEEDKALQLCRERKKFVRQALDGMCSLAASQFNYTQSLKIIGTDLRKFVESEAPAESSFYASTSATPEPLAVMGKSISRFSLSSPSLSQHVDANENLSPSPSPPASGWYHANHMKFRGAFSRKVEEKPPTTATVSVTSSSAPQGDMLHSTGRPETLPTEAPPIEPETPAWDYFGIFHSLENHISLQGGRGLSQQLDNADDLRQLREEEGIPELEDEEEEEEEEEEKIFTPGWEHSQESEDEFDEPTPDKLVRSFENVNRAADHGAASASQAIPSTESVPSEPEFLNGERINSPDLPPLGASSPGVMISNDVKGKSEKGDGTENKVVPKDFISSMKDIEFLFIKASESGKEVPRMLEANKFHFRPIFPGKEGGSFRSTLLKNCFSCGDDPSQVQEEPPQNSVKYLTWHRTTSSRSSSSRNPLDTDTKDDIEDVTKNLFDEFCMISGSHASTLDRLYAWERKLYDEVKASQLVRREYDLKCKLLRQLESKSESLTKVDKTRAVVKDLHCRIRVAIYRIDSISKKIEELRDTELQPQLEELIQGLTKMWKVMLECHKLQFHIISIAYGNIKISSSQSELHQQITINLENDLSFLSSSFTKWIDAQKTYVKTINDWLFKCVSLQKSVKRKRRTEPPPLRDFGPPIYVTCGVWLDKLDALPTMEVVNSIKGLAAEISGFLPRQDKNQGKGVFMNRHRPHLDVGSNNGDLGVNLLRAVDGVGEASKDWRTRCDGFLSSLEGFLGHLNNFAESSVNMFTELERDIQNAKNKYEKPKPLH